jgi:hypothetical protein
MGDAIMTDAAAFAAVVAATDAEGKNKKSTL